MIIVGFVGSEFGPRLNKVDIIEHGFVTKFNKVGIIGYPNPTKRVPSMQNLIENSSKWALSEPNLGPNLTKWTLSGFKSNHVRIIGGGSCPRVDLVRKVCILFGKGVHFQKQWSYCVGVVRVDVTTPTPYGFLFRKYQPLPHHIATLVKMNTLSYSKIKRNCVTVNKLGGQAYNSQSQAERPDQS